MVAFHKKTKDRGFEDGPVGFDVPSNIGIILIGIHYMVEVILASQLL